MCIDFCCSVETLYVFSHHQTVSACIHNTKISLLHFNLQTNYLIRVYTTPFFILLRMEADLDVFLEALLTGGAKTSAV